MGPAADPPRLGRPGQAEERGGGPYTLQAEIAACHARAADVTSTDWRRIAALYVVLRHLTPSPVLDLNHAVAVSRADGPAAGLERLDALTEVHSLQRYPLFHAARGDMLERLGRFPEAAAAFVRAAELETNQALRAVFARRAEHQRRMRDSNPRGREPNTLSKSALRRSVSVQSTVRGGDYMHCNRS